MTRDEIIRMAREAGHHSGVAAHDGELLQRFAALVAAAERNRTWTQAHWTEYERSIVAAEREACADIADQHFSCEGIAQRIAAAIRARGQA